MFRTKAFASIMLAAGCIATSSVAHAGNMVPNKVLALSWVGYCDGMTLNINQSTGVVTGNRTGCVTALARGYAGAIAGGAYDGQGVVVGTADGYIWVISDSPQTWQVVQLSSGAIINSGTWAVGAPALEARVGPPSTR